MDLLKQGRDNRATRFCSLEHIGDGLGFSVRQIIDALRDVRLVLLAPLASFVAMPLSALSLWTRYSDDVQGMSASNCLQLCAITRRALGAPL
jgi:hypothetical protein